MPELTLRETVRIDGRVADLVPVHVRRNFHDLILSDDGRIAVLQAQDHGVILFDSIGSVIGRFGRQGSGPGEFRSVNHIGWLGDSLWIYDGYLRRVSLVGPDLSLVRTFDLPLIAETSESLENALRVSLPYAVFPDSSLIVRADHGNDGVLARMQMRRNEATLLATVASAADLHTIVASNGAQNAAIPFPDHLPAFISSSSGATLAIVRTDIEDRIFSVAVLRMPVGDTLLSAPHPFQGLPLSRDVADSMIETRVAPMRSMAPELAGLYEREAYVPPVFPPIKDVRLGNDGTLWIQIHSAGSNRMYIAFDSLGQVLGHVTLPNQSAAAAVSRAFAWIVERDSLGMTSLVRYSVE